jgi:predicted HicB family RNase H-like nuclease
MPTPETTPERTRQAGRPAKAAADRFTSPILALRVPAQLKAKLQAQAEAAGVTLSEFVLPALQKLAR